MCGCVEEIVCVGQARADLCQMRKPYVRHLVAARLQQHARGSAQPTGGWHAVGARPLCRTTNPRQEEK